MKTTTLKAERTTVHVVLKPAHRFGSWQVQCMADCFRTQFYIMSAGDFWPQTVIK